MSTYPFVSIIILNWNNWKDTIECLESIYQINYPNYNIVLIDNGSNNKSIEKIQKYCKGEIQVKSNFFKYNMSNKPIRIFDYEKEKLKQIKVDKEYNKISSNRKLTLIRNKKNYGFAEGNNIGMKFAAKKLKTDFILLLNNDTVATSQFLVELIKSAQKNKDIGILGPSIHNYNSPTKINSKGAIINFWTGGFHFIKDYDSHNRNFEVDFVEGSAILIKKSLTDKLGYLFKDYFAYWEETDYCIKAKNKGYKVINIPKAVIYHKTSSTLSSYNLKRIYLILRNNIIFMRRNAKKKHWPTFIIYFLFIRIPSFVIGGINNNPKNTLKLVSISLKALIDGLTFNTKK